MDSLNYRYYVGTNQLRRITDSIQPNDYNDPEGRIVDIDGQPDSNYVYDDIGNLIQDKKEKIDSIKWNVYGKIQEITKNDAGAITTIKYTYDALGNRISQTVIPPAGGDKVYTWYVRDAQGNIMSTYKAVGNDSDLKALDLKQTERYLYGSSRLGLITSDDGVNDGPDPLQPYRSQLGYDRGNKQYELTNHLGNVLATVSDRKFAVPSDTSSLIDHYEPHIVTAQDYYPFGMLSRVDLPGSGKSYKFGFNGQEMNNDVKGGLGNSYTAQFWEYDSRIGRRWNLDPVKKYSLSPYATYSNNPLIMLDPKGNDEYWEIDAKTGVVKMVKSDWVGDDVWIKDKDGNFKKLHEIKLELSKSSRQFDMGVASVLANYVASDPIKKTESSITLNPDGIGKTSFDPNTNQIEIAVVDGYINKDLTNMFNLRSAINDHESGHKQDFANNVKTNVLTHLNVYMNQVAEFSLTSDDFKVTTIINGLNYLYTLKEEKYLDDKTIGEYFTKFFKMSTDAGFSIKPETQDGNIIGFTIKNKKDRTEYTTDFKSMKDEQNSK
jgi:RHS repeat-associated protein